MSTEKELKELMNLVQDIKDYGCQQDYAAFESRLRSILAELEAARDDAARYRWLTEQSWFQAAFDRFDPDDHGRIDLFKLECARLIDAARKGEA